MNTPKTLLEAIRYFSDPDQALATMVRFRWPNGVTCPHCQATDVAFMEKRRIWQCRGCRKQFSIKVGSLMEDSALGLDKWLSAMWLIVNAKNGISSCEIGRALGITQKSAWFLLHRIRQAMQSGTFERLSGEVEADETFIGGKSKNMHQHRKTGRGPGGKTVVLGMLERRSEEKASRVKAKVIGKRNPENIQQGVREHVEEGSMLYTDELAAYNALEDDYLHEMVNHAEEYARGVVHTNGLENFWSLLKRGLGGTYVSVEPWHLSKYIDEQAFRFNERKNTDAGRFEEVASQIAGRRLTYKELTGADAPAQEGA